MDSSMTTATNSGGGAVVSFGSGDRRGRTQRSAVGRGGQRNASRNQVSSLRSRISRGGTTGPSTAARQRRALLKRLDAAANARGNINRRSLASIDSDLRALVSRGR